jgi:ribosomal protein S18 acetylase RimI-like enzyme
MPGNTPDNRLAMNALRYHIGNDLELDQVIALYRASTLGERRPVDDREAMASMLQHANLVVTAWNGEQLVGIARTLTDFSYVGYLSDLAVHSDFQRTGIGRELIRRTREQMGPKARIVLLAAPAAIDYYPRIGFTQHHSAWILQGTDPFPRSAPAHKD